ncbi:MAG: hypothetical protein R8K47_04060, partial [Mariprofundaceae bacterium]
AASGSPFVFLSTADPARWLIVDDQARGARGMLRMEGSRHEFALEGRIDLDRLGTVFFLLDGKMNDEGEIDRLRLEIRPDIRKTEQHLATALPDWLAELIHRHPHLQTRLEAARGAP